MPKLSKILYFLISFVFFVFFDGYLSEFILENGYKLQDNKVFDLIFIQNHGAAFNLLQGSKIFLIIFSAAALTGIAFYTIKHIRNISGIGLFFTSLLCAGIFSNMYERIVFGYVRDYIKLNFVDFPIFNISDIFINLSVFVIVIIIIKNSYTKNNETHN